MSGLASYSDEVKNLELSTRLVLGFDVSQIH